jgi:hypothetical protein
MKMIALIAPLALAGCMTTYAGVSGREVVATYQTSKSQDEVAACLARALGRQGAPMILDEGANKIVSFNYQGQTDLHITLTPDG